MLIPPYANDCRPEAGPQHGRWPGARRLHAGFGPDPDGLGAASANAAMPVRREDFDRRLCKMAADMKISDGGLGSGMQTLNVVLGGTLYQHVSEDVPRRCIIAIQWRSTTGTSSTSSMDEVMGHLRSRRNPRKFRTSHGHQSAGPAVQGDGSRPDGVIEFYESNDPKWFCVGVQFHPGRRYGVGARHADIPRIPSCLQRRSTRNDSRWVNVFAA